MAQNKSVYLQVYSKKIFFALFKKNQKSSI